MDELGESSLLFSLESLLETERERVQREAREAHERREQELRRVAEVGERRRVAAQKEREARERRQALERERERLDYERIEAMKQATIERVRIEAESHARLIELEQSQKHEVALSRLREDAGRARYRTLFWLSTAGLIAAVVLGLLAVFALERPARVREQQRSKSVLDATETRLRATELALSAERSKSETLEARLRQAQAAPPVAPGPPKPVRLESRQGRPPQGERRSQGVCKDDGDPINGCVP